GFGVAPGDGGVVADLLVRGELPTVFGPLVDEGFDAAAAVDGDFAAEAEGGVCTGGAAAEFARGDVGIHGPDTLEEAITERQPGGVGGDPADLPAAFHARTGAPEIRAALRRDRVAAGG